MQNAVKISYRTARRIIVAVSGSTVLAIGIVMIVAPGPAFVVIPVGLAILGLEFAWARIWLKRHRKTLSANNSRAHADRAERHRHRQAG